MHRVSAVNYRKSIDKGLFWISEAELNLVEGGRYGFRMPPPDGEPFHLSVNYRS